MFTLFIDAVNSSTKDIVWKPEKLPVDDAAINFNDHARTIAASLQHV